MNPRPPMNRPLSFGAYALPSYHVGIDPPQGEFMRRLLDLLASAETLGFDSLWLNEHHFSAWGGMIPSPPMALAALSQRTQRVRLGTSILVAGLHHPLQLAEQMAMLDLMSGGRLDLGIGRGSEAFDYEAFGLDYDHAQARTQEALEVILKAWTGQPVKHTGEHFQVNDVTVWPTPQQRPHPPVWISCSGTPASFEWTAQHGYNLLCLGFIHPVDRLAESTRLYRQAWQAAGHADGGFQIATLYHTVVRENGAEARSIAVQAFQRFLGQLRMSQVRPTRYIRPPRPAVQIDDAAVEQLVSQSRLIAGTPDEVAATFAYLREEVGFDQIDLMFQFGGQSFESAQKSMDLFAREVLPRLRVSQPTPAPASPSTPPPAPKAALPA